MKEKFKFILGALIIIPLLPLLAWQGKRVKSSVPELPEAKGPRGVVSSGGEGKLSILAIGESTLAGVGVSTHEEGFTGTLAKELSRVLDKEVIWRVYARSGYTAEKLHKKILPKIEEKAVDLIVVGTGGNDAFQMNNPWRWTRNIETLIHGLRAHFGDTPIVFLNMPPIKEFPAFTSLIHFTLGNLVEILGDTLATIVSSESHIFYYDKKITLSDWIKEMNLDAERADFFSDGVHPSKLTYQTWAKDLAVFVTSKNIIP